MRPLPTLHHDTTGMISSKVFHRAVRSFQDPPAELQIDLHDEDVGTDSTSGN